MIIYTIIVLLLTVIYTGLFISYLAGWLLLPDYKPGKVSGHTTVSIVVAARNEEKHIAKLLRDLTHQQYPASLTEIMVVDDGSTDKTAEIVTSFQSKGVKLIALNELLEAEELVAGHKKKALATGIASTKGELIVTTDADCSMDESWLTAIVSFYEQQQCKMIVAPVAYTGEKSFLERFQSLDFLGMIGITGATLQLNFPVMCNGANLAFSRLAFEQVNGYERINHIASGDDVLLMHKIAARWKGTVHFLKSKDALVRTYAQSEWTMFVRQRIRWASKSKYYADLRITANLVFVYLFNISILVTAGCCFFDSRYSLILAMQVVLKMIVEFAFLSSVTAFFGRRELMWLFLPAQLLHIIYIVFIGTLGNTVNTEWKGRKVS